MARQPQKHDKTSYIMMLNRLAPRTRFIQQNHSVTVQGKRVVRGLRFNIITVQSIPQTSAIALPKFQNSIKFKLNTHNEKDLSMNLHNRLAFQICKGLNSLPLLHPKKARMYQSMVKFNCTRSYQKTLNIFWWKRILHIGYRCISSCCEIRWLSLLQFT